MNFSRAPLLLALAWLATAGLLLPGLDRDGLWDPWELAEAERAWSLATPEATAEPAADPGPDVVSAPPSLALRWSAWSLRAFGQREWAGRLPFALAGLLAVVVAGLLAWRFAGPDAAAMASLVAGTSPLLLVNARTAMGASPGMLAQGLVGLAVAEAVVRPARAEPLGRAGAAARAAAVLAAAWLGVEASGALLGAVPPLAAGALWVGFDAIRRGTEPDPARRALAWGVAALGVLLTARVALAVVADHAAYGPWLGGAPRALEPPTFEVLIERVFHGFAPWSALLVLALGALVAGRAPGAAADGEPEAAGLRPFLALWIACTYAATTLFGARYGETTWLALAPLAVAVALLLGDVRRSGAGWGAGALVVGMFVFLLWRDLRLYPGSPLAALPVRGVEAPEAFNPMRVWAAVLGLFGLTAGLALGLPVREGRPRPDLRAPYRLVRAQWARGPGFRAWLVVGALAVGGVAVFGLVAWTLPMVPLTTIARRVGRLLLVGLVALPLVVAGAQVAVAWVSRAGRARLPAVMVAGLVVGGWVAHGWLPALADELSPRRVFETYRRHAGDGEPFAEYRLGTRAAAYYVDAPIESVETELALVRFLTEGGRRWALLPPDQLGGVDRAFRRQTGRHLVVADRESAYATLVASEPVEGLADDNPLVEAVRDEAPAVDVPVGARFGDQIVLVGYDLELPHEGYVGAGETFAITWIWQALRPVPGSYQVFVHMDGQGQRIHGDHEPVDGKYPVRLWEPGDVIVDRQELTVPANYRPGPYTIFVGFYAGERRLEVTEGEEDGSDRVRAGVLQVR